jgi:leucyl/phenylalanyl-tRNA--protein transferase
VPVIASWIDNATMSAHHPHTLPLVWLSDSDEFPPVDTAWGPDSPAPGLLAAGGSLDVASLVKAYCRGIFPWFSEGQPVLWWSTDPRMALRVHEFRLHRSLKKTIRHWRQSERLEIRMDSDFARVIQACASTPRDGQKGTWIIAPMVEAYTKLHHAQMAHSVETWLDGELAGGLYLVNLGGMVYGESMFAWRTDASKVALAALVAFCRAKGLGLIDCQQETAHLATMGAAPIARRDFVHQLPEVLGRTAPQWRFSPLYWDEIDPSSPVP